MGGKTGEEGGELAAVTNGWYSPSVTGDMDRPFATGSLI